MSGFGGFLSDVFGNGGASATASTTSDGGLFGNPGTIISINSDPLGLSSVVGGITSALSPQSTDSVSSVTLTSQLSSSTISLVSSSLTPSSTSSGTSATGSSAVSTTSSSSSEAQTTPPPTSVQATSTFATTSDGQVYTVTSFVNAVTSGTASSTAVPVPSHKTFLQNTPLAATVLTLVGLIALCIAVSVLAFVLRRLRQKRLHDEAIVWPDVNAHGGSSSPTRMSAGNTSVGAGRDAYYEQDNAEKARGSIEKYGSEESVATGYGPGSTLVDHGVQRKMDQYKQDYPAPPPNQGFYQPGINPQWAPAPGTQYPNLYQNYAPPVPMKSPPIQNPYPQPPQRALLPQLNVITATPNPPSHLGAGSSPRTLAFPSSPSPQNLDTPAAGSAVQRTSLINANMGNSSPTEREPLSPGGRVGRRQSAHARELDPSMPALPMPSPLPETFGKDEYASRVSTENKTLKVANE